MKRARLLLLALAGLALPVALALGVYAASAGSLTAVPAVIEAPTTIAREASTEGQATTTAPSQPPPTTTAGDDDRDDDLPGKCRKPENRLDPDCDPRTADRDDDDSSGPGSGGDDDSSGSGSSGSGSDDDSSGHGSGDDD